MMSSFLFMHQSVRALSREVILLVFLLTATTSLAGPGETDESPPGEWCGTEVRWAAKGSPGIAMPSGGCPIHGDCDLADVRDSFIPGGGAPPLVMRIKFNIFREDDGSNPAATQTDIVEQLAQLNVAFAPHGVQFVSDTEFMDDSTYRHLTPGEEFPMKAIYADAPEQQCNVYVLNMQFDSTIGLGTFPWDPDALGEQGGILVDDDWFGAGESLLVHEVGHNVGLWHTHHGVSEVDLCSDCYERADGLDGDATGDFAGDTPPTPKNFSCAPPGGIDDCSGQGWGPTQPENYMSYGYSCHSMFTAHQAGRVHCWIDSVLDGWSVPIDACTVLSTDSFMWSDPGGDGDGIPEAGEEGITLQICLHSDADIANVQTTLEALHPGVDVYDSSSDYGLISGGVVDCGDEIFRMDINFTPSDYVVFTLHASFELAGEQCWQDLSFIKWFPADGICEPAFEICSIEWDDSSQDCGNGDGFLQSGENVELRLSIHNIGSAQATGVDVRLAGIPDGFSCFDQHYIGYPDLSHGAGPCESAPDGGPCKWPASAANHWDVCIPRDVSGEFDVSVVVEYAEGGLQTIPGGLSLLITPAAWLEVTPGSYDFGVAGTDATIVIPIDVRNDGNDVMHVESIVGCPPSVSWSGPEGPFMPFVVASQSSEEVLIEIDTEQAPLGAFECTACVVSDANVCDEGEDDCIVIQGLISSAIPVWSVAGATAVEMNDISTESNLIVWSENRIGGEFSWDIFAFDVAAGEEMLICQCPGSQTFPRIDGHLVAWTEGDTGDIHARNLATGEEFTVAGAPARERMVGVSGPYVAFLREYYQEPGVDANNLWLYDTRTGGELNVTGFVHDGLSAMGTVHPFTHDFGGGTLVWHESTWIWQSGGWWKSESPRIKKWEPDVEPVPVQIWSGYAFRIATNCGRIAFSDYDDGGHLWIWESGTLTELSSGEPAHGIRNLALGCEVVVYDKDDGQDLFGLPLSGGPEFAIPPGENQFDGGARADCTALVWATVPSSLWYSYLLVGDLALLDLEPPAEPVFAGVPFSATLEVMNVSTWSSDAATVRIYDGEDLIADEPLEPMEPEKIVTIIVEDLVLESGPLCAVIEAPWCEHPLNNRVCAVLEIRIPGACCLADGTCEASTLPDDCAALGGFYQGDGTTCFGGLCPPLIGACCLSDGSCLDGVSSAECTLIAGVYQGDGTVCDKTSCPPPGPIVLCVPEDYDTIAEAMEAADHGDEVKVGPGTYAERIDLDGKAITIWSTDGPEVTIIDGGQMGSVVTAASGEGPDSVLEGFTITNGDADFGGGFYVFGSSPTIRNCIIEYNTASVRGGGAYIQDGAPLFEDCCFEWNKSMGDSGSGAGGGGVFALRGEPSFARCVFLENTAEGPGGALNFLGDEAAWMAPMLLNCEIISNEAQRGGGLAQSYAMTELTNCLFAGNHAVTRGGAANSHESSPIFTNCTVVANTPGDQVGGIRISGSQSEPWLTNCILWWNGGSEEFDQITTQQGADPAKVNISYCCVQGWTGSYGGPGMIASNPQFMAAGGGNENPATIEDNDYRLSAGSPCIDAASNDAVPPDVFDLDDDGNILELLPVDLDGEARLRDDAGTDDTGQGSPPVVDMGPYEFQDQTVPGDIDGDGQVGFSDLLEILNDWGPCPPPPFSCPGDCDHDGSIGFTDLLKVLHEWGS